MLVGQSYLQVSGSRVQHTMVVLTQFLAPAPEAINDNYEYNVSQAIRKETNRVGCSLPSPFES